jgi:NADPH2:quinone reductase
MIGGSRGLEEDMKAIVVSKHGGPEVLEWRDHEVGNPGPGEVRIRQEAVGLNFIDVYFRTGLYPAPQWLASGSRQ